MPAKWTTTFRGHRITVYSWWVDRKYSRREFFVVHHYGERD
jgi:hypothetical protein